MNVRSSWKTIGLLLLAFAVAGCGSNARRDQFAFRIGDNVRVGPFTYTVIESHWKPQLSGTLSTRVPEQQFLMIRLTITNSGGKEASVPLLSLEDKRGSEYRELQDGSGVDNWLGLIRTIAPAQTEDGWIVFDVPQNDYILRCVSGGDEETEQVSRVEIPLSLDSLQDEMQKSDNPIVPPPVNR